MKRLVGYALVGVVTMAIVVGVQVLTHPAPSSGAEDVPGPDLRAASLVGCYELNVAPWTVARDVRAVTADRGGPGSAAASDSAAAVRASDSAAGRNAPRVDAIGSLPRPLTPPARVMLLPDSADAFARRSATSRAVPVPEDEDHPERALRWFTRADTLWILWSERGVRAGMALFERGDRLAGSARALSDSLDVSARATAWRINCSTFMREVPTGLDRR